MATTDNKHNNFIIHAKSNVNDEFYTLYETINKELSFYDYQFNDKIVYCNCDDLRSNFVKYFIDNFNRLKLKKLYASSLDHNLIEYDGNNTTISTLNSGDLFGEECTRILKCSDIVVTNPPFSLLEKFIHHMFHHDKKFLIIGNNNLITYRTIFPYFINKQIWLGKTLFTGTYPYFLVPDEFVTNINGHYKEINGKKYKQVNNTCWFTNINIEKNNVILYIDKQYNDTYTKYDDVDILNCDLVKNIPVDYVNKIGVPLTILKYLHDDGLIHCVNNDEQILYKIIGCMCRNKIDEYNFGYPTINGKRKFARIIIKKYIPEN